MYHSINYIFYIKHFLDFKLIIIINNLTSFFILIINKTIFINLI